MLADLFIAEAEELVAGIDTASSCWEDVIGAEPSLTRFVGGDDLDAALEAMADLVDMKSPRMSGHSRGVANLALEAGRISGLADDELSALHRAGFLHDLGRLGISNAIWDKPGLGSGLVGSCCGQAWWSTPRRPERAGDLGGGDRAGEPPAAVYRCIARCWGWNRAG